MLAPHHRRPAPPAPLPCSPKKATKTCPRICPPGCPVGLDGLCHCECPAGCDNGANCCYPCPPGFQVRLPAAASAGPRQRTQPHRPCLPMASSHPSTVPCPLVDPPPSAPLPTPFCRIAPTTAAPSARPRARACAASLWTAVPCSASCTRAWTMRTSAPGESNRGGGGGARSRAAAAVAEQLVVLWQQQQERHWPLVKATPALTCPPPLSSGLLLQPGGTASGDEPARGVGWRRGHPRPQGGQHHQRLSVCRAAPGTGNQVAVVFPCVFVALRGGRWPPCLPQRGQLPAGAGLQ